MPSPTSFADGTPIWVDLASSSPADARAFYEGVFGWSSDVSGEEYGGYVMFSSGESVVAGLGTNRDPDSAPDAWMIYLASKDLDRTAAAIGNSHGQVIVEPMDIPQMGRMLVAVDATGAVFGVWQPTGMNGFDVVGEDNAPAWFELLTTDYKTAIGFYTRAFGVVTEIMGDDDDFRYSQILDGDAEVAGIMDASRFLPEGVPSHWSVYFQVEDTDATIERVTRLGGRVVQPAENTPYGRLATVTDTTGAQFKLIADVE
ncbi:VOC family protein [Desertivibrio insolitus]|uniref:VOC family protein n=1 Tax=Herbiconiux sp. SYSU D00978 TaxID=2812562 RepID=UPI001A978949|nr:VOC family protein [Herbiconiux sp. SYSU D00978]